MGSRHESLLKQIALDILEREEYISELEKQRDEYKRKYEELLSKHKEQKSEDEFFCASFDFN